MTALTSGQIDALLARVHHGRLGIWTGQRVYVVPVGFVWNDGCVWFHSADGRKTGALTEHPDCCFEADEYDPQTADWSSVIAWGRARPHGTPAAWAAMMARFSHVLHRVLDGPPRGSLWCIDVSEITGRSGP